MSSVDIKIVFYVNLISFYQIMKNFDNLVRCSQYANMTYVWIAIEYGFSPFKIFIILG